MANPRDKTGELSNQPPMPPTGVPEAVVEATHKQKKVAILSGGLAPRPTLPSDLYDQMLRAEVKQNIQQKQLARGRSAYRKRFSRGPLGNVEPAVPGGTLARKMDHDQHEQVKLQNIGIDLRKTTPSFAERKRMRQNQSQKGKE